MVYMVTLHEWRHHAWRHHDMATYGFARPPDCHLSWYYTIKALKKGKSCGPDGIPNEIFINANKPLRNEILHHLNEISKTYNLPKQWQEGEIKRLYKGKGNKGKCSAERGITLANNFGKLYERILNNRVLKLINITDAQAGGKKGRATVDHLLVIKEIIQLAKVTRKPN